MSQALYQLAGHTLGKFDRFEGRTVIPLIGSTTSHLDDLMLGDGLNSGLVAIQEVSEDGSVPDLINENRTDRPVLTVDGEELVGAKQNRVANPTLLVSPSASTRIPLACVEQGRWSSVSKTIALSQQIPFARGRAKKLASV